MNQLTLVISKYMPRLIFKSLLLAKVYLVLMPPPVVTNNYYFFPVMNKYMAVFSYLSLFLIFFSIFNEYYSPG